MSKLSSQEKLALIMTAVGSQRKLAEFMGISHQKLGRWLKEGQEGGVKSIPDDPFTREGIDAIFNAYKDVAKKRAKELNVPFNSSVPVYYDRPYLARPDKRTGEFIRGDRVIVRNAMHIDRDLRAKVLTHVHDTDKYLAVSVQSVVNLHAYSNRSEQEHQNKRRSDVQKMYRREFRAMLKEGITRRAIFTKLEDIRGFTDTWRVIENVDRKLRQKHEPATGDAGTKLADSYLFQLKPTRKPASHANTQSSPKPSAAKLARRRAKTMGRKPR